MSPTDFQVKELVVTGYQKSWGDVGSGGAAGGTEVSMTVIPSDPDQEGWTAMEAKIVALEARRDIQLLLYSDAQLRKIQIPEGAKHILSEYSAEIRKLKESLGPRVGWKEKTQPLDLSGT